MASTEHSLRSLETLMTEFFDIRTTNERKREIESVLNNFTQTKDAWRHSLFFIGHTGNEYVIMYCLNVLENLINKQWLGFDGQDKIKIRNTLNQFLLIHHTVVPSYIRNKIVKLVVHIGRIDWPHFYPDFFPSILQLAQGQDTTMLGVILLRTASEELAAPREDLSMARKDELHRLLLVQVPNVLSILNNLLETVLEKHRHLVAATPPPSPTQGDSGISRRSSLMLFSSSPIRSDTLLSSMFKSPIRGTRMEALPPLDDESQQLCSAALSCLAHYFSWIPLSTTITPTLLSTIFHYAGFGCEVRNNRASSPNMSFSNSTQCLGVLAMNCVNELLSKNCVPQEFEDFLLQMFQQTFYLLQKMTKESSTNPTGNRLAELEDSYVEKFTDFLRLFVSIHLRRFEGSAQFPVLEFLALLFKYTFRQPGNDGFFNCLDIWNTFLDYLLTKLQERTADGHNTVSRYQEALLSLVSHILQKFQFRFNQSQLEELDDDTLDDDSETEWQHFLRQCLEVIAKVAELLTAETFQLIWEPFKDYMNVYMGLETCVINGMQGRRLNITGENECRRLHCTLRDLSSLLQALGRLADHFIGEKFAERYTIAQVLVDKLVETVTYGSKHKLFEVTSVAQSVLQPDFIQVHAQAMAATKAYAHWLAQLYGVSQRTNQEKEKLYNLIVKLIDAVAPLINKEVPERVAHSAAHLFLSMATTVRPSFLIQLPSMQTLYNMASRGVFTSLKQEIQLLMCRSLSHYLLLPWPGLPELEQDWANRASHHQSFIQSLTARYIQVKTMADLADNKVLQQELKPVIRVTLQIMQDLIESLAGEVVKSKQICYQSLQESIQMTLTIFPIYIQQTDVVDDIMSFFLALFQGLRVQMGVPFTEQAIRTFMNLFSREQLAETISQESSTGFRVIEKFLKILQLIVQEPGSSFKSFLPQILSICLEQIYPIIAPRPAPDIKSVLYELLHELMMNNWRYFFKGSVMSTLNSQSEHVENGPQFTTIMQSYGQSFLQPDIAIFKQNLESLESLNSKWKLYHKKIFMEMMLCQFLNVLIQVLVQKSHDLLQEEIVITVYNMASIDFDGFYSTYLPQFLTNMEGLDDNQKTVLAHNFKMDTDLPSFTQSTHRFVNDIRYYRLINNSLPEGSVKF
ncbi:exportin-6-like [Haliotis cracherodii]|uniref:exportin-6-like n=1 Tax=Haliotis cracherodii TaxID=6455 RepID=UPI0039E78DB8